MQENSLFWIDFVYNHPKWGLFALKEHLFSPFFPFLKSLAQLLYILRQDYFIG
jgi:hypothetical protein